MATRRVGLKRRLWQCLDWGTEPHSHCITAGKKPTTSGTLGVSWTKSHDLLDFEGKEGRHKPLTFSAPRSKTHTESPASRWTLWIYGNKAMVIPLTELYFGRGWEVLLISSCWWVTLLKLGDMGMQGLGVAPVPGWVVTPYTSLSYQWCFGLSCPEFPLQETPRQSWLHTKYTNYEACVGLTAHYAPMNKVGPFI